MSASILIDETNGTSPGVVTASVSNLNAGSQDAPNLEFKATNYIIAGTNSYTKYQKIRFASLGTATTISALRIWVSSGAFITDEDIRTNLTVSNYTAAVYTTPTNSAYVGSGSVKIADPGAANLGIGGSLTGAITTVGGTSDYWVWQLQTSSYTPSGPLNQKTFTIAWTEA